MRYSLGLIGLVSGSLIEPLTSVTPHCDYAYQRPLVVYYDCGIKTEDVTFKAYIEPNETLKCTEYCQTAIESTKTYGQDNGHSECTSINLMLYQRYKALYDNKCNGVPIAPEKMDAHKTTSTTTTTTTTTKVAADKMSSGLKTATVQPTASYSTSGDSMHVAKIVALVMGIITLIILLTLLARYFCIRRRLMTA